MSRVKLDTIESRPTDAAGGSDEVMNEILDLGRRHLPGHGPGGRVIDGGRGDRRRAANLFLRLSSGVSQLNEDLRGMLVNGFRDPGQALDEAVIVDGDLPRARLARWLNVCVSRDDQSNLAFGQLFKEPDLPVRDGPVVLGHVIMRRGTDKPIGHGHAADVDGGQEDGTGILIVHAPIV